MVVLFCRPPLVVRRVAVIAPQLIFPDVEIGPLPTLNEEKVASPIPVIFHCDVAPSITPNSFEIL